MSQFMSSDNQTSETEEILRYWRGCRFTNTAHVGQTYANGIITNLAQHNSRAMSSRHVIRQDRQNTTLALRAIIDQNLVFMHTPSTSG